MRPVADMLKAIHAGEDRQAAQDKAEAVIEKLNALRLKEAAQRVEDGIAETLTYYSFPASHWRRIRTNNPRITSYNVCYTKLLRTPPRSRR